MESDNTYIALAKLDELIRDPQSRQQFHEDPYATLQNARVELEDVPPNVLQTLTEMTLEELGALADLDAALAEAGLFDGNRVYKFVV
jgi:hypothetical protein